MEKWKTKNHNPYGSRTLRPQDTSAPWHFGTTKLVPKFKTNHRWSCVSSQLSWVEVSRLFLDHGTRVKVSRTTFLVSKCLEIGAEVAQSVLMPKCLVAEVSGNHTYGLCGNVMRCATEWTEMIFTARSSLHGICYSNSVRPSVRLSVRLSVCLSHSWTVSTWFDLRSWFLHHRVAPSF